MQRIMPILPVTDLRNQAREALDQAQRQPVVITQNGRPSAVLVNYQTYNDLVDQIEQLQTQLQEERRIWSRLSEASLARVWNNEADAAYDNWRELYGLSAR